MESPSHDNKDSRDDEMQNLSTNVFITPGVTQSPDTAFIMTSVHWSLERIGRNDSNNIQSIPNDITKAGVISEAISI